MSTNDRATIYVDFDHMATYDYLLADAVKDNHYRFEPYLAKAVQNFVRKVRVLSSLINTHPTHRSTRRTFSTTNATASSRWLSTTCRRPARSEICAPNASDNSQLSAGQLPGPRRFGRS